jgi:phospholipid/cholesterol/gamma-HCH transport system ATP-binding protein
MLFQGSALFDSLRVWENVAFGLIQGHNMERQAAKKVALAKLAAVGLEPTVGELRPAELSGGMQKRVHRTCAGSGCRADGDYPQRPASARSV